ncbi:MAG: tetratricopeptide repeat protein [Planctomycetota bacterium]|jgi:Flp pilus assembly protein TadD
MSHTSRAKLIFSVMLPVGCMVLIIGCSESARPEPNWVQNEPLSDFDKQADRPPTGKTLWAMAGILAAQGKDSQCEFVLRRIIYEHPAFLPAYNSLAEVRMRQGRTKAAIETLHEGLKVDPAAPVLLNNLGMCWMILQDNDQALEVFTEAAGIMPENPKYRANMAVALGLMGREEESLSLFNQVLPADLANQNLAVLTKSEDASGPNSVVPVEKSNSQGGTRGPEQ